MNPSPFNTQIPLCHVELVDLLGGDPPRAGGDAAGEAVEVELAADLGVGAARVRDVVAVERHHVRQHVRAVLVVCNGRRSA